MNRTHYMWVKMGVAAVLAAVVSSAVVANNYTAIGIAVVLAAGFLLYIRSRVTDVVHDERDLSVGGKAALLTIQICSWIAAATALVLFAFRATNPFYEIIGSTLAYGACFMLLLYSFIFRYYDQIEFNRRKVAFAIGAALVIGVMLIVGIRLFSGEDTWMCESGKWVPHGQPSFPAPTIPCE